MDRETWNSLGDSDKKAWDGPSDQAKTKVTACHFNKGKEHASQGSEVNKMEAKEHDLVFDDSEDELEAKQHDLQFDDNSDEEHEDQVEVNKHEMAHVSNAETARKMHEDEGVDFDMILQAQQANLRLQVRQHEQHDPNSSDDESTAADLEVNAHNLEKKGRALPTIEGPMCFFGSENKNESQSEDEEEHDKAHFDSAEDQRDFEAIVNAERAVCKLDNDESIGEEASTESCNQKKESKILPKIKGLTACLCENSVRSVSFQLSLPSA